MSFKVIATHDNRRWSENEREEKRERRIVCEVAEVEVGGSENEKQKQVVKMFSVFQVC